MERNYRKEIQLYSLQTLGIRNALCMWHMKATLEVPVNNKIETIEQIDNKQEKEEIKQEIVAKWGNRVADIAFLSPLVSSIRVGVI